MTLAAAILIDPPFHFATRSAKGQGRSPSLHYRTMALDEIKLDRFDPAERAS
jgi:hypothetical protein